VAWVYDGDSLRLEDGRKLRLIGIDTPELGRDSAPDRPGAEPARARLRRLLDARAGRVLLRPGIEPSDRYGRRLVHLYLPDGRNLARLMLAEGLGFAVAVPPNLRHLDCYFDAEGRARSARRGLWRGDPAIQAIDLPASAEGFHLIRGRIRRVGNSRRALWLNLHGGLALRVDSPDLQYFADLETDARQGRALEVRGWIYRRKGEQRMQLRHPASLRWLED
jgi:endonuclease YncB( thermonuclease family)